MTEPVAIRFTDDGAIPNSALPMLVYRQAVPADPDAIEALFAANGWPPAWRDGVHPFHHFHSTAHEALGVARGEATVLFGGPGGQILHLRAGDVAVLPAGVGHCSQSHSPDLMIVGAYPDGTRHLLDTRRGEPTDIAAMRRNIAEVAVPACDPLGRALAELWQPSQHG